MEELYNHYSVIPASIICIIWIASISSIIGVYQNKTNFFYFGPSNETIFVDFKVDTWSKWVIIVLYSFLSQFVYSYINSTIHPFVLNVIRDYKCEWNDLEIKAQIITFIYKFYYWFHSICQVFLVLTLQLQYYLPALIADIIVGIITTRKFVNNSQRIQYYKTEYGYTRI